MKIAFFGYAWNKALQPDAYMSETITALAGTGADVDVYLGSQLTKEYGIYGLNAAMQPGRIGAFIAAQGYDAAVSFNNSMLIPEVLAAMPGRIVTVIVDEPEHLFDYHRTGPWPVFASDVEIVAMSSRLEQRLIEAVPGVRQRLRFMLPATNVVAGPRPEPFLPISWVASYVGDANLDQYMQLVAESPDVRTLTLRCLQIIERDGDLRSIRDTATPEAALIAALPWSFDFFQTQMQNVLTNRARLAVVERLAKHGLALFGNAGWRKLLTHDGAVLQALQSGPAPGSHADLTRIYNASRISINAPQAHTAVGAVQYRMIDVMASGALFDHPPRPALRSQPRLRRRLPGAHLARPRRAGTALRPLPRPRGRAARTRRPLQRPPGVRLQLRRARPRAARRGGRDAAASRRARPGPPHGPQRARRPRLGRRGLTTRPASFPLTAPR